jgi:hypothetical protein
VRSEQDIRAVVASLVTQARGGDVQAAKELLPRVLGKPLELDLLEHIGELEDALERLTQGVTSVGLGRRVKQLGALVDGLVAAAGKPCAACGRGTGIERLVVLLEGDEELRESSCCKLPIDPQGEAAGGVLASGEFRLNVIRLEEEPAA